MSPRPAISAIITTSKLLANELDRCLEIPVCVFPPERLGRACVGGAALDDAVCGVWAALTSVRRRPCSALRATETSTASSRIGTRPRSKLGVACRGGPMIAQLGKADTFEHCGTCRRNDG